MSYGEGSHTLTEAHEEGAGFKGIKYPLGSTDSRLARRWWKAVARPQSLCYLEYDGISHLHRFFARLWTATPHCTMPSVAHAISVLWPTA